MTAPDGDRMDTAPDLESHWRDLVTAALLGTDRRDPPEPVGPIADLVADTARAAPSERMLAHVAATTAVRRAGVRPGPVIDALAPPEVDARPPCVPAATERWTHITQSWPILEDEWMSTLIVNGWRASPELVPALLLRHRRDPVRSARVFVAAGPVAGWLVEHLPDLGPTQPVRAADLDAALDSVALAELPIPPELAGLLDEPGATVGSVVGTGLERGGLGHAHRAVLVNVVARMRAEGLDDLADVLRSVDPHAAGHGLAVTLADLAVTRSRMLDELRPPSTVASDRPPPSARAG